MKRTEDLSAIAYLSTGTLYHSSTYHVELHSSVFDYPRVAHFSGSGRTPEQIRDFIMNFARLTLSVCLKTKLHKKDISVKIVDLA